MEIKPTKQYFVILWQEELEMPATLAQRLVYFAIKSFTANGKQATALSLRDIKSRCHVSIPWIRDATEKLTKMGKIEIVGQETRQGGKINVYSVKSVNTLGARSVKSVTRSVKSLGTKLPQSNKVIYFPRGKPLGVSSKKRDKDPDFQVTLKSLLSYMFRKSHSKVPLVGKQAAALKKIMAAGYIQADVEWAIDQLWEDPFWKGKGFDLMTVADQLPKLKMAKKGGNRNWRDKIPKG